MTTAEAGRPDLAADLNAALPALLPAAARMGLTITTAAPGHVAALMPLAGNTNQLGTMYAGALFTVAEFLGGLIATTTFDTATYYPVAKDFRITYHKPAKGDAAATASLSGADLARIRDEAAAHGKADYILESAIIVDGATVATTIGQFQLRAFHR